MKNLTKTAILSFAAVATPATLAVAHTGHVHAEAGHSHYIAIAACAAAGGIVAYLAIKAVKKINAFKAKRAA